MHVSSCPGSLEVLVQARVCRRRGFASASGVDLKVGWCISHSYTTERVSSFSLDVLRVPGESWGGVKGWGIQGAFHTKSAFSLK